VKRIPRHALWIIGALAMLAACAPSPGPVVVADALGPAIPLATPEGVTIQDTGPPPANQGGYDRPLIGAVYADTRGMTLYTYAQDPAGKSVCNDSCAKDHPPFTAPADTAAPLDWSTTIRDDGTRQWAYRGKPLYTAAKDTRIGHTNGKDPLAGWTVAAVEPGKGMRLPAGINVQEFTNAAGQALVDDSGRPLYVFDGDAWRDDTACVTTSCPNRWVPFAAPQVAKPIGQFTVFNKGDGIYQWAFRGKPLFTFEGDRKPGDATGTAAHPRWHVALAVRYFMPAGVRVSPNHFGGFNLVTADGMTLYQRGRWRPVNGGQVVSAGSRDHPFVGRLLGTTTCESACTQTWRPLHAPADARPTGYWEVMTRADGSKQWAYQGYPLYTFSADKKPGDMGGNEITDYMPLGSKDTFLIADKGTRLEGGGYGAAAMYWHATLP